MALVLLTAVLCDAIVRLINGYQFLLIPGAFRVVALTAIIFLIWRGRGWARWLLLILTAWSSMQLGVALLEPLPESARNVPNIIYAIRSVAAGLCLLAATVLVLGPGRAWFRR